MSISEINEELDRANREAFARLNADQEITLADAIIKLLHTNPWGPC
jgi:uncharacterized protein YbjQ (UPF0145 family)